MSRSSGIPSRSLASSAVCCEIVRIWCAQRISPNRAIQAVAASPHASR